MNVSQRPMERKVEFNPGDVVRLKSGGPNMTVESVGERAMMGGEAVFCIWFEKVGNKQVVKRDAFPPVTLQVAPKPGTSTAYLSRA
ncbi:DUF2158 domain-containing protein [Parvibaculum sp.]|uniref:YodC family protein n=1 Tax=Parvibaculum sp. TaxID=2024848 RepID=UPI0025F21D11|nr:DUF2158 domain-containing protein [Parvibaculum sp.]